MPLEAPNNVGLDGDGFQVIYRQPVNHYELRQVVLAANSDPFGGYGVDGDAHWTIASIRAWWAGPRFKIEQEIERLCKIQRSLDYREKDFCYWAGLSRWLRYLQEDLSQYLQMYAFFLDTRRSPLPGELLPDL